MAEQRKAYLDLGDGRGPADPHQAGRVAQPLEGQAQGAADQPHADDGDAFEEG